MLFYYENVDKFKQLNVPLFLYGLMIPLLFIRNIGPILVVSIISLINIYIYPELPYIEEVQKEEEEEEEEEDSDEEEEEDSEEEEEDSEEEEEAQANDEEKDEENEAQANDEENEAQANDEEKDEEKKAEDDIECNHNCNEELIDINCYLTILTDVENKKQYVVNKFISTSTSKITQLGSINLVDLILLEIEMLEQDIEKLKQDNEIYEYATFDKKLYELTNANLECAWRRYKDILSENEYKDNTYTIL